MMLPECQRYFDLLMRYYAWLVDEYGFAVIHVKNGHMGSCSFILQSGDCRLFMSVEREVMDFPQLALAPAAAQLDACAPELRWYHVADIIDYLRGYYASWPQIEERRQLFTSLPPDEVRMRFVMEHRSFWPQIMELFREDEFKRCQADLEKFLQRKERDLHRQSMIAARRREMAWLKQGQDLQYQQELEECIKDMEKNTGEEFDKTQVKWLELAHKASKGKGNKPTE